MITIRIVRGLNGDVEGTEIGFEGVTLTELIVAAVAPINNTAHAVEGTKIV